MILNRQDTDLFQCMLVMTNETSVGNFFAQAIMDDDISPTKYAAYYSLFNSARTAYQASPSNLYYTDIANPAHTYQATGISDFPHPPSTKTGS